MSQSTETKAGEQTQHDEKSKPVIHRVCISCNNMFTVSLENYEAKHCPVCHKA